MHVGRILCPIDFSDFSRRALDHAAAIAKWYESTITLLHVHAIAPLAAYAPTSGLRPYAGLSPDEREALLASMKSFALIESGTAVPIEFELVEGHAATAILAVAKDLPADLLVMGTHGRSGFERLVLGSVAEKVLRKSECPVLSVPARAPDAVPAPSALYQEIVCAIDFSDCSLQALDYAISLARESDAHLTVVHVIELPPDVPRDTHETVLAGPRSLREYVALAEEDGRARLMEAVPDSVRTSCSVDTMQATGKPYREILRVSEAQHADLLVIGIHGRGPMDRLLFGSTAQHLVRQASCPVLTVRQE
jgi:nucleotide-binding universal stress UspA family protein